MLLVSFTITIKKRSKVYMTQTRLPKSSLIGAITGIVNCFVFFIKEFVNLIQLLY